MKKITIILFLLPHLIIAQSEESDHKLYNLAMVRWNNIGIGPNVDSVVLIKKLHKKLVRFEITFSDYGVDSYEHPEAAHLYTELGKNMIFFDRIIEDKSLTTTLQTLTKNFGKHPKIQSKLLRQQKLRIKPISWWRYYSFHFPVFRRVNMWNKIKRKFGAKYVLMFSDVEYQGKYAVFYYAYYCGRLCGSGDIVVFEKVNNQWRSLGKVNIWMS